MHPQAFKRISKETSFTDEEAIFYSIGLEENLEKQIAPSDLYKLLKNKLKELEQQPTFRTNKLFTNIIVLGEMVGLSAIEKELLLFILVIQSSNGTRRSLEYLGMTSFPNLVHHLSYILKIKSDQIYEAFRNDGPLCASGLINLDKTRYLMDLPDRIEILDGLVQAMQEPRANFENALCNFFFKVPPPKLTLSNFQHLEEDLNILRTLLKASLMKKTAGVNILIYGSPGTGKTELVRVVAASLGVSLYEVSSQDRDGDPASDSQRLRSYLLCQSLFSRRQDCLILFDEIEDIFPKETLPLFGLIKRSGSNKSWTNRVLERNVIPAIWVSNSVEQIDPAFLRRFDLILEVPYPPPTVRRQMVEKLTKGLNVGDEWLEVWGRNSHLVPGHMEKAIKVAGLVGTDDKFSTEQVLTRVVRNLHKAMGLNHRNLDNKQKDQVYDLAFLNTDFNPEQVIKVCQAESSLKVCLHGPSGTGKTAFVHCLAEKLYKKVITKRASDILDPYVGQTEKHLAAMFAEASAENDCILFLDEADSFLQNRLRARHSWEITGVNELLVQMENFEGHFFCATNLLETLDNAVFRRFDLKIKFDFLRADQAWGLLQKVLSTHDVINSPEMETLWRTKLAKLSKLTPGDFATVVRQLKFAKGDVNANMLINLLERESMYKYGDIKYLVGF